MSLKKNISIKLWSECFDDSPQFIDFYFNNIYNDLYTYIYVENGEPISHLQTIPYTLYYNGKTHPINYISGACTTLNKRGNGYMQKLMLSALSDREKRGDKYSVLIPANDSLFCFYEKMGYKTFFFQDKTEKLSGMKYFLPNRNLRDHDIRQLISQSEDLRTFANVKHSIGQITNIIKEYTLFDNYDIVYIKDSKGAFVGVAFIYINQSDITINAVFCSSDIFDYLMYKVFRKYPNHNIYIVKPSDGIHSVRKGMIKCLSDSNFCIYNDIGFFNLMHE